MEGGRHGGQGEDSVLRRASSGGISRPSGYYTSVGLEPFLRMISEKSGARSSHWKEHSQVTPPSAVLLQLSLISKAMI